MRLFFKTLRAVIGALVLVGDRLARAVGIGGAPAEQLAVDARTRALALYHFPTCPFCLKTRRVVRRLSLAIELRDAQNDPAHRAALVAGGGKPQVPCLLITDAEGRQTWLYESDAINAWLNREFGGAAAA